MKLEVGSFKSNLAVKHAPENTFPKSLIWFLKLYTMIELDIGWWKFRPNLRD